MAPLDDVVERHGHVVAQVVEAELRVRPVRHVARICLAPLRERHEVLDEAHRAPELLVDGLRPLGVTLGEVVVDRDEVDTPACEPVEVERLHGDEGLALARLHLCDVALVEDDAAHQLDVEEADADRAPERLADGGVRVEEEVLERLAVLEPLLELGGLAAELVVGQLLEVGLERADVRGLLGEALDAAPLAHAKDLLELPERGGGHGSRVPAGLPDRPLLARHQTVTARSPSVHRAPTSVAHVDAARLDTIPLFAGLTLDQRATVAEACAELSVDAGTTLVREGDFGHGAFAILSGNADVVHDDAVLRSLGPGDMFGEIAVLSGGRRTASVVATTDMMLVTVLNRDLWRIERECPEIADALRATIAERLGEPAADPAA